MTTLAELSTKAPRTAEKMEIAFTAIRDGEPALARELLIEMCAMAWAEGRRSAAAELLGRTP